MSASAFIERRFTTGEIFVKRVLVLYLACIFGANAVLLIDIDYETGFRDNGLFVVSWLLLYAMSLSTLVVAKIRFSSFVLLFAFCFLVVLSSFKTIDPLGSLPYSLLLVGNAIFAYVVAKRLFLMDGLVLIQKLLVWMVIVGMVGCILGYEPFFYHDPHERLTVLGTQPIRGLFAHKVMGSLYAVVGLVLTYFLVSSAWKWPIMLLFVVFVLSTGSSTGLVLLPAAVFIAIYFRLAARNRLSAGTTALILILLTSAAVVVAGYNIDLIAGYLGREGSLTGRVPLWKWGGIAWLQEPLLGWGFKGYWGSMHAIDYKENIDLFANYNVPHFHNSYIQTAVYFGAVGLIILLLVLFYCVSRLYTAFLLYRSDAVFAGLVVIMLFMFVSVAMHLFFAYNHAATFILFMLFFMSLDRPLYGI